MSDGLNECPCCGYFDRLVPVPFVLDMGTEPICIDCYFWVLSIAGDI